MEAQTFAGARDSVLLPPDYLRACVLRIVSYALAITCLQLICHIAVRRHTVSGSGLNSTETGSDIVLMNSFQLTNFFVNLCLGGWGIWWWFFVLPSGCSDSEKIGDPISVEDSRCLSPPFFAEFQLAYQLWGIPLCIAVGESSAMMGHHSFVAVLASLGSTLVASPRYFCVYFFGVVEASSVFLAIMNAFKSRPEWIKAMPRIFAASKLIFSAAFFLTRIVLWIPVLYDFWGIAWDIGTSRGEENPLYYVLMGAVFSPVIFLTVLQLFWAGKIVNGLVKMTNRPTDSGWETGLSTKKIR